MDITGLDPSVLETVVVASPIAAGLVEVAKQAGLSERLYNTAAIVFGIAAAALLIDDPASRDVLLAGVVAGLAGTGIYERLSNVLGEPDAPGH